MQQATLQLQERPIVYKVHDYNSIAPWDVDYTYAAEQQRKRRLLAMRQLRKRKYRQSPSIYSSLDRKPSISKITEISTDLLEMKSRLRYLSCQENDQSKTIDHSRYNYEKEELKLPSLQKIREFQEPLKQLRLKGRKCRSNRQYHSPASIKNQISEQMKKMRNEAPVTELTPMRFEYERMNRKNSLYKWLNNRKDSILNNVYEQIKKTIN